MEKILTLLEDYFGTWVFVTVLIITAAISYGSSQATASITFTDHNTRILSLESDNKKNTEELIRIDQKVTDLWHDSGHKE